MASRLKLLHQFDRPAQGFQQLDVRLRMAGFSFHLLEAPQIVDKFICEGRRRFAESIYEGGKVRSSCHPCLSLNRVIARAWVALLSG